MLLLPDQGEMGIERSEAGSDARPFLADVVCGESTRGGTDFAFGGLEPGLYGLYATTVDGRVGVLVVHLEAHHTGGAAPSELWFEREESVQVEVGEEPEVVFEIDQ